MIGFFFAFIPTTSTKKLCKLSPPPPPPPTVLLISLFWIYSIRLFYTIGRRRIVQNIIEWLVIKTSYSLFLLGQMVMVATASSLRSKCPALFKMRSLSVIMPMLLYPLFKLRMSYLVYTHLQGVPRSLYQQIRKENSRERKSNPYL